MHVELLWMLTILVAAAFACQWIAWRVRIPAILFLLLVGLALGPFTHLLNPDLLLGELLFPVVSLSVAVILFEGSLSLRLHELRGIGAAVHGLVTYGALAAFGLLAVAAHFIGGVAWPVALLFGALTAVTGPTVVMPMLRTVRPNVRTANVLRWEGIILPVADGQGADRSGHRSAPRRDAADDEFGERLYAPDANALDGQELHQHHHEPAVGQRRLQHDDHHLPLTTAVALAAMDAWGRIGSGACDGVPTAASSCTHLRLSVIPAQAAIHAGAGIRVRRDQHRNDGQERATQAARRSPEAQA